jgi:hypothetical protein
MLQCSDDVVRRDLTRCLRHDDCDVVFVGVEELRATTKTS